MAKKEKNVFKTGLIAGAGLITTIAGGYFLYGPQGKDNRKQIKSWMIKARGDMLAEIEKMKEVTKENYDASVDKISAKYSKLKDVGEKDIDMLRKDLKKYWNQIQSDVKKINSTPKKK